MVAQNNRFFNLPAQLTSLVGRSQDTKRVCAQLRRPEVRILTLLGPGGVGKTRLMLAAATELYNDFTDGVVLVSLAPIRDAQLVIPAIADVLGLQRGALEDIQRFLRDRHLLLVLDNFEQVASAAPQIEDLLVACSQVKVLITSRVALRVQGEHEYPVLPLSLPDLHTLSQVPIDEIFDRYAAIELFVQRAQALLPQFQLTPENMQTIAALCIRLDGLPLAIELAAARIKFLPPQALLARFSQRLSLLTEGAHTLPERQKTLRNTLQWSYDLLSPGEQQLLRCLSVFVNGCTLEAIAAVYTGGVADQASDKMSSISSLIDHSLLFQMQLDAPEPRFGMLETVREYAFECLQEHGEAKEIRRAHALYFLALAEEAASHASKGEQQRQWLEQLKEEQENLRAASGFLIERQETELAVQLNGALWWYWVNRGYFSEGRSWLAAALELPHIDEYTRARARALCGAGDLAMRQGNYQAAVVLLEESVAGYQQLEETRGLAEALLILGVSLPYLQQFSKARASIEQSIILSRAVDDQWLLGHAQDSLARLAWRQGDIETTRTLAEANLQMAPQHRDIRAQISPRKLLALVALAQGDYARAAELAQELLAISQEVGDRESEFSALYTLGTIALRQSDDVQALVLYKRGLTLAHESGGTRNISMTLARLGEVAYVQGNNVLASEHYQKSLSHADTFEDKEVIGVALLGLARIAKAEKHYWRAAHLLGAAEARINVGSDLDALARVAYGRDAAALRTYLGKEAYIQAQNEGRNMTPEQALTLREPSPKPLKVSSIYPDELTEREVEVLRLVANGLSDAQVAERLIISPRTVQGHLRSIYSKIQVNSRGAATRYAIERNLL